MIEIKLKKEKTIYEEDNLSLKDILSLKVKESDFKLKNIYILWEYEHSFAHNEYNLSINFGYGDVYVQFHKVNNSHGFGLEFNETIFETHIHKDTPEEFINMIVKIIEEKTKGLVIHQIEQ